MAQAHVIQYELDKMDSKCGWKLIQEEKFQKIILNYFDCFIFFGFHDANWNNKFS